MYKFLIFKKAKLAIRNHFDIAFGIWIYLGVEYFYHDLDLFEQNLDCEKSVKKEK